MSTQAHDVAFVARPAAGPALSEEGTIQRSLDSAIARRAQARDIRQAVQRRTDEGSTTNGPDPHRVAAAGLAGGAGPLPHLQRIQEAFGGHDVSRVRSHVGGPAADAGHQLGAHAYATGEDVAFTASPDLHTAAHEAAHVVQQRAGVALDGGVGHEGDPYERHADAVADAVVEGDSVQELLDAGPRGGGGDALQCEPEREKASEADGATTTGPAEGDVATARRQLSEALAITENPAAPLTDAERVALRASIQQALTHLSAFEALARKGATQTRLLGGFAFVAGGVLADDATGFGFVDDVLLPFLALGALATWAVTSSPADDVDLERAWSQVVADLTGIAQIGPTLVALRLNGKKLGGNTTQLAIHLARLLGLASVGGQPSGEPPGDGRDDEHWWKEIKAFLKNIRDSIKGASRKQVMRELEKYFTRDEILEIERRLVEAARKMGDDVPPFLP